jgi:hypothetical protein
VDLRAYRIAGHVHEVKGELSPVELGEKDPAAAADGDVQSGCLCKLPRPLECRAGRGQPGEDQQPGDVCSPLGERSDQGFQPAHLVVRDRLYLQRSVQGARLGRRSLQGISPVRTGQVEFDAQVRGLQGTQALQLVLGQCLPV